MFLAQSSVEPLAYTLDLFSRQDLQLAWEFVRMVSIVTTLVGLPLLLATSATTPIGVYSRT